ncbi:unnamed protein product [marine sediment metagenome]|uniref:BppU N-terminal domain-containing protein n=1 Tax=marine sediment metagenome TaxID=412755 RepID=X0YEV9_9ZZZZ
MADISIPRADKGFKLVFTVQDSTGAAYNLSGYTIKLKVWKLGGSDAPIVDSDCVAISEAAGTCSYTIGADDFLVAGLYKCELELTKTDHIESTRSYTLEVTESP